MYKRGVAATVLFKAIDSTDGVSGKTGLTFTTKNIIKDGAAPTPLTSAPTECGGGWYLASLTGTEFTAESIGLDFQVSGAVIAPIVIHTEADYTAARAAAIDSIGTATNAGDMATKQADAAVLTTGSNTSGSYSNTATDDDVFWITAPVSPAVGGFGLRQQLTFNLPLGRTPINIQVRGYFNGSSNSVDVYALNSRTATYDKLTNAKTDLASRSTETLYSIPLPRDYADSSGGSYNIVTLEFRTASTNTSHRLRLDQVLIAHVAEGVAVTLTAPSAEQIWSYVTRELTTPGAEPVTVPTADEVADEVQTRTIAAVTTVGAVTGNVGGSVASVTAAVTVGTNNDKTGYALSGAGVQAIWDALTSAFTTVGSIGKKLADWAVGTLTSGERTAIANEFEAQIIDDTDSEKVLEAITNKIAAVNPDLSGLTIGAIASGVWANGTRTLSAGTNIVLAKGTGVTGFNDLSAAAVNAEVDTAIADAALATAANLATVLADTNELQAEWADGGRLDLILDSAASGGSAPTAVDIADEVATRTLDANIKKVNNITISGTGAPGVDPWGPAP